LGFVVKHRGEDGLKREFSFQSPKLAGASSLTYEIETDESIEPVKERNESKRRARDSRAPPVEGGADGCDARALSA